jgi:hypothetical protein
MPKGDNLRGRGISQPLDVRFRDKFVQGAPDQCWAWKGGRTIKGYGVIWSFELKHVVLAHRVAYELHHGMTLPRSRKHVIMHTCDNPGCVNPAHLRFDTQGTNLLDAHTKGRKRYVPHDAPRGERHHRAVLTAELVVQFRAQLAAGKTVKELIQETGFSSGALYNMRDRKTWKHVP